MIKQFFGTIFEQSDWAEIRCLLRGTETVEKRWTRAGEIQNLTAELQTLNATGYDIYAGINPRRGYGLSSDANVILVRCLFADFDHIDSGGMAAGDYILQKIEDAGLPMPTVLVNSGHGIHAYWKLSEPIYDMKLSRQLQTRLAAFLGSDSSIINAERIMRCPGFLNYKPPKADSYIIAAEQSRIYSLAEIEAVLPAQTQKTVQTIAPIVKPKSTEAERVLLQARLYALHFEQELKGGRNPKAFSYAARLREKFPLTESQILEIMADWNQRNPEPLDDSELRQVVFNAYNKYAKKPAASGYTPMQSQKAVEFIDTPRPEDPSGELAAAFEDEISGRNMPIDWPWDALNGLTLSLTPGAVCLLCGCPGASKTLMTFQAISFWIERGIKVAIFELEDKRVYHMRRVLAQLDGVADFTNPKWVKANPVVVREAIARHKTAIDAFGRSLWVTETSPTLEQISDWIKKRCDDGARIIVVDPATAAVQTDKPWIVDNNFLQAAKRIIADAGASLILVTHPQKNMSCPDMNQLAGSAAYSRFSHTIFWLELHEPKESEVRTPHGTCNLSHNRTVHLLKVRNGQGQGWRLAYKFDSSSITLNELGAIIKKPKTRT